MEWAEGGGREEGETEHRVRESKNVDDHWRDTRGPRESVFSFFKVSMIIAYCMQRRMVQWRETDQSLRTERECCRSNGLEWQEGLGSGLQ